MKRITSAPAESDRRRGYFLQGKDALLDAKVVVTGGQSVGS